MAVYQRGDVRIHYQEAGSGFPLLIIPGGGLNSTISWVAKAAPFDAIEEFKDEYRCITADLRNAYYSVTRDFVRSCQTPTLVLPDDSPPHPYTVAMESVMLAPKSEVSLFPWKEPKNRIPLAVRQTRSFLRAHRPVTT